MGIQSLVSQAKALLEAEEKKPKEDKTIEEKSKKERVNNVAQKESYHPPNRAVRRKSRLAINELEEFAKTTEKTKSTSNSSIAPLQIEKNVEKKGINTGMKLIAMLDEPCTLLPFVSGEAFVDELVFVSRQLISATVSEQLEYEKILKLLEDLVKVIQRGLPTVSKQSAKEIIKFTKKTITYASELKSIQEGGSGFDSFKTSMRNLLGEVKQAITFSPENGSEVQAAIAVLLDLTEQIDLFKAESKNINISQMLNKSKRAFEELNKSMTDNNLTAIIVAFETLVGACRFVSSLPLEGAHEEISILTRNLLIKAMEYVMSYRANNKTIIQEKLNLLKKEVALSREIFGTIFDHFCFKCNKLISVIFFSPSFVI